MRKPDFSIGWPWKPQNPPPAWKSAATAEIGRLSGNCLQENRTVLFSIDHHSGSEGSSPDRNISIPICWIRKRKNRHPAPVS